MSIFRFIAALFEFIAIATIFCLTCLCVFRLFSNDAKTYKSLQLQYKSKYIYKVFYDTSDSKNFYGRYAEKGYLIFTDAYLISICSDINSSEIRIPVNKINNYSFNKDERITTIYFTEKNNSFSFSPSSKGAFFNFYAKLKGGNFIKYLKNNFSEAAVHEIYTI